MDTWLWFVLAGGLALTGLIWLIFGRRSGPGRTEGDDASSSAQQSDFERLIGKPAPRRTGPQAPFTDQCRWARDHFRADSKQTRWVCTLCDAEVMLPTGQVPTTCRRPDRRLQPA